MEHQENSEFVEQLNLTDIYMKISISEDDEFDTREEDIILNKSLESCLNENILMIDSNLLLKDVNKLNLTFVTYITFCRNNHNYKRCGKMFIVYCDYFNLDYHKCYNNLHEKVQNLIRKDLIKMLGGIANFTKIKNKLNPESITTLFDLFNKF